MPDKIVNHFVLADGSVARYDYDGLVNVPFGDDVTKVSFKTRTGYINTSGNHVGAGSDTQEVYTNKLPCFPNDTIYAEFLWTSSSVKWIACAYYDEDGRFISRSSALYSGSATSATVTVTIPTDTYYYAFMWRTYGNCSTKFFYKGSLVNVRNKIDRGLTDEDLQGGFDYGHTNDWLGNQVITAGFRVISDFIKVPASKKIVLFKDTSYTNAINCVTLQFDANKTYVSQLGFRVVNTTGTAITVDNGVSYVRIGFDSQGNPNTLAGSPTADTIRQNVRIVAEDVEQPLTPIICGSNIHGVPNTNRPAWDTSAGTFTIPYDCIFYKDGQEVRPSYLMGVATSTPTVLTIPTTSSALRLFFDVAACDYVWYSWSDTITNYDDLILVAVFRTHPLGLAISINGPYIIDGKPYGIDTTAEVDFEAIAWAFNENVKGVNHRGYNTIAPENTLPAYKLSKQVGFKYCETDVSYTSDGIAVLLHDDTINRTGRNADGTEISQTISISSITYEQALQYDFGIYKGSQYAGTKIPTFEQFITLCRNLGLHPYIELKAGTEAQTQGLVDIVKQNGMDGKVTWISFSSQLLTYVKNYDAAARLGFVVGNVTAANITTAQGMKTTDNEVFIDCSDITTEMVAACIAADIPVEIWTVNSASTIEGLDPYISGVTSDNLIAAKVLYEANI